MTVPNRGPLKTGVTVYDKHLAWSLFVRLAVFFSFTTKKGKMD